MLTFSSDDLSYYQQIGGETTRVNENKVKCTLESTGLRTVYITK